MWSVGKVMLKAHGSLHLPLRAASAWNLHPTESGYQIIERVNRSKKTRSSEQGTDPPAPGWNWALG